MSEILALLVFFCWVGLIPRGWASLWLKDSAAAKPTMELCSRPVSRMDAGDQKNVTPSTKETTGPLLPTKNRRVVQQKIGKRLGDAHIEPTAHDSDDSTSADDEKNGGKTPSSNAPSLRRTSSSGPLPYYTSANSTNTVLPPTILEQDGLGNKSEGPLLFWLDNLGVATFAIVGCRAAASLNCHPLVCIIAGCCTACGGGAVRDVICGLPYQRRSNCRIFHSVSPLYVTTAFFGGVVFMMFLKLPELFGNGWRVDPDSLGEVVGYALVFVVVFVLRFLAETYNLGVPSWTNGMRCRTEL